MSKKITFRMIIVCLMLMLSAVALTAQTSVRVISPNGGETLRAGAAYTITWSSQGIGSTEYVAIDYSIDNGVRWIGITSETPNDGSFRWVIPQTPSTRVLVRISHSAVAEATACETRGIWVVASSVDTPAEREAMLDKILRANLNTVMVSTPQLSGNWGYGSHANFLAFISEAKRRGLSVHAWIPNARRLWTIDQLCVDYRDPAEQAAQSQWVQDIMALYADYLDGVHLDYIRYLEFELVNQDGKMDGLRAAVRRIHTDLKANYPDKVLTAAVFTLKPNRIDSKTTGDQTVWKNQVPAWFRNWCEANPGTIYTNSNYYYMGPHHLQLQQDPVGWLKEGIIDAVMPMQYTTDDAIWQRETNFWKIFNTFVEGDFTKVYPAAAWKPDFYDVPGNIRKIKYDRTQGMKGNFIFRFSYLDVSDEPMIQGLTIDSEVNEFNAPYKTKMASCLMKKGKTTVSDVSNGVFTITSDEQPPVTGGSVKDFSVFAQNSLLLRNGVRINSGYVGVRDASTQPMLGGDAEMAVSSGSWLSDQAPAFANRLLVKPDASLGAVNSRTVRNYGTIRGRINSNQVFPLNIAMPVCPAVNPTTGALAVAENQNVTLTPGAYGSITVRKGGTLTLSGGVYQIRNLVLEDYGKLLCRANSQINILNRFESINHNIIGPADGASVTASGIVFFINGKNGTTGALTETPQTAIIGLNNTVTANFCAPNGTILVKSRSKMTGALAGKDIMLDYYVEVNHASGF